MDEIDDVIEELQHIPWFQELKPAHVRRLASITQLRNVRADEVLFREGDKEDYVYIVLDGRIGLDLHIPHRGRVRFYTADRWEIFGWSSVTPNVRQRTAAARGSLWPLAVRDPATPGCGSRRVARSVCPGPAGVHHIPYDPAEGCAGHVPELRSGPPTRPGEPHGSTSPC